VTLSLRSEGDAADDSHPGPTTAMILWTWLRKVAKKPPDSPIWGFGWRLSRSRRPVHRTSAIGAV